MERLKIFAGTVGKDLAQRICADPLINMPLGRCVVDKFSDGEVQIQYAEEVRGVEVYIVQPLINAHSIIELCLMIDAACRSAAQSVIAVVPYLAYMRQERKSQPRIPISAKWMIDTIINSGAKRIITIDLHANAIQGFVSADKQFDNLYAGRAICDFYKTLYEEKGINIKTDVFSVAPDNGSAERTRALSDRFGIKDRVIIDKRRPAPGESKIMNIIGTFKKGQRALILDDILDTGRTICNAADTLTAKGACAVDVGITHPVLSGPAIKLLKANKSLENIVVTDTYPLPRKKDFPKIKIISVARMLAQAIKHQNKGMSISALFDQTPPYTILKK